MLSDEEREYYVTTDYTYDDACATNPPVKRLDQCTLLFTYDGETWQVKVIDKLISERHPLATNIKFFKFAAACSLTQQPNDKMPGFRILKKKYKMLEGVEINYDHWPDYMTVCEEALSPVDPASTRTFLKFLLHLPTYLSDAYTMSKVKSGWESAGLYPYNPQHILNYWPNAATLTGEQSDGILDAISKLTATAKPGFLSDHDVITVINPFLPTDITEEYLAKPAEDRVAFNRWRCVLANGEGTIQKRKQNSSSQANPAIKRRKSGATKITVDTKFKCDVISCKSAYVGEEPCKCTHLYYNREQCQKRNNWFCEHHAPHNNHRNCKVVSPSSD